MSVDLEKQLDVVAEDKTKLVLEKLDGEKLEFKLETFPVYKTKRVMQIISRIKDKVDILTLVGEIIALTQDAETDEERADKTIIAFQAIPRLMDFAPEVLLDFAALAVISKKELSEAYENGSIEELIHNNKKLFDLEFDASVLIKVLSAYLPHIGINFLVREMKNLNDSVVALSPKYTG